MQRATKIFSQLNSNLVASNKLYQNETVILDNYPVNDVKPSNFRIKRETLHTPLNTGDILIEITCISIDAYLRTTMYKNPKIHHGVALNKKMTSIAVGRIIESRNNNYNIGQFVTGGLGIEKYTLITSKQLQSGMSGIQKINSKNAADAEHYLTILGLTSGCSAYAGVNYAGTKPVGKDSVIAVNAASGAVGSIVCQLYRNKGCKVIAITGGAKKKQHLLEGLGLYACIDYKNEDLERGIKRYAPDGVDVFFDNVGGKQLDILLGNLKENAQIILCGAISQYSTNLESGNLDGPSNYLKLAEKNAEMKGFTMFAYMDKLHKIRTDLSNMVDNGTLSMKLTPVHGVENFAVAMDKLLKGDKIGKVLLYP